MDVECLAEQNEEAVTAAQTALNRHGGLGPVVSDGTLIELFGEVHDGRGFTDLFSSYEPTYYRQDTALARDYVWFDRNPVIVFMPFWKESEEGFEEYTGLSLDGFFTQVREGYLIPVFGAAEEYEENPLFERLFAEWDERLDGKEPLFANALERAVLRNDDIAQEQIEGEMSGTKFWRGEANYLVSEYPGLADVDIVTPTEELKQRNPLRFFAERRFMLRTAGFETVTALLDELLERFKRASGPSEAQGFLEDAALFAFFVHMVYSGPIYYSMGGGNTYSFDDYVSGIRFAEELREQRKEQHIGVRAAEQLFSPLSRHLSTRTDPLVVRMPEREGAREKFIDSSGVPVEREKMTDVKTQVQNSIAGWQRGDTDRSEVRAQRNELHECLQNYISEVEREIRAPNDAVDIAFEVSGRTLSHLPTEPVDDPVTAGMELFSALQESGVINTVNEEVFQRRRRKRLGEDKPVSASLINNINVWQVDVNPTDLEERIDRL